MSDLVFEVTEDPRGGFVAECVGEDIVTQAETWAELRESVLESVRAHFFDSAPPERIHLRFTRSEIVSTR